MDSVTWREIITYMWNDGLREVVTPKLRSVAQLAACIAVPVSIKHYTYVYSWYMEYVGWTPTVGVLIGLGLALFYALVLMVIALCACTIHGEFDLEYLTIVLTSSVAMGVAISPFAPLMFRAPPTVPVYILNGTAIVMAMWAAVTFVYCVVMTVYCVVILARVLRREFAEYVQYVRREIAHRRE